MAAQVIAALLLASSLVAGAAAVGGAPDGGPPISSITISDSRGSDDKPLSVKVTQLPATSADEIAREDRDRAERVTSERSNFQLAVIAVGVAVVTALILIGHLSVFRTQAERLRQSIEEAKRATQATETSARAAERTVEAMDNTARRQLRAYVAIEDARINRVDAGAKPEALLTIRNFGQTPAYRFAVSAQTDFVLVGAETHPAPDDPPVLGHLAPGAEFRVAAQSLYTLNMSSLMQLQNGAANVFVHGIIRYVDTFGQPHFTRFRTTMGGPHHEIPSHRVLISCYEGNETDDDERLKSLPGQACSPIAR